MNGPEAKNVTLYLYTYQLYYINVQCMALNIFYTFHLLNSSVREIFQLLFELN